VGRVTPLLFQIKAAAEDLGIAHAQLCGKTMRS
jgi:hypothetical protein